MMNIILAILLGGAFGFALYYVGVAQRKNIRAMLRLEDLTVMKIILFAIGMASTLLALSSLAGLFNITHLSVKEMNAGVLLGGIIFGIGFGWAGNCPGTALAGLPHTNKVKTFGVIVGGLVGALTFSLSYENWQAWGLFSALNYGKISLFQLSTKFPAVFNIGFIGLLVMGILFMLTAYVLPYKICN